ncbi:MAG TPA: cupin domain-containing protein, partial [Thermomicrobiales bacterium]|nr:cupin domain-containing protein [Thermomicrobiales bacterium]
PTRQAHNEWTTVTEWRFAPGAHTGWHRHEWRYVVVPLSTGRLTIDAAAGVSHADLVAGHAYARPAGVEHDVINDNPFEFVFVEIEFTG